MNRNRSDIFNVDPEPSRVSHQRYAPPAPVSHSSNSNNHHHNNNSDHNLRGLPAPTSPPARNRRQDLSFPLPSSSSSSSSPMSSHPHVHQFVGHCWCKAVTVRAAGKPTASFYCHCSSCRGATNSPAPWSISFTGASQWSINGPVTVVQTTPGKTHRHFCSQCHTPVLLEKPEYQMAGIYGQCLFPNGKVPAFMAPTMRLNYQERIMDEEDSLLKYRDVPRKFAGSNILLSNNGVQIRPAVVK